MAKERNEELTEEQRSAYARSLANARWANKTADQRRESLEPARKALAQKQARYERLEAEEAAREAQAAFLAGNGGEQ